MYLTSSRPDIMFAVCACARFQVNPKISHLHYVKRIFIYLKGQPKLGLWYPNDSPFDLVAYTDNDYVGASLDRKSTTRGCQFLGFRLISWQCKKQTVVANSTTKAEYIAASICSDYTTNDWKGMECKSSKDELDETVTKEREDIMERAATTASSLERRVDSGNINRTQSMATLNDPKSFGKHGVSLVRQQKLTAQAKEIPSLKKIVKKLERKRKSKTLGMNLFNIGTSKRRSLGEEDASKRTSEELETGKQRRCKAVTTYNADSVKDEERKTKIRDVKQEPSKIARKTNSTTSPTFDLKTKSKGSETKQEGSSKRAGQDLEPESTKKQKMDEE
ncbi:hypothetical protein Tco_0887546 [Tanacetum coccineum]